MQERQPKFLPPHDAEYVGDWTTLLTGEEVHILSENAVQLSGRVDTVTQDGEILWLHLSAGAGRKLFLRAEDVVVWCIRSDGQSG